METGRDVVECCVAGGCQPGQQQEEKEARLEVNEMRMLRWMCGGCDKDG